MRRTLAIAKYSTTTDATFIPKLTKIATSVDTPSMRAMNSGPISLQVRSIRLICALMAESTINKMDKIAQYQLTSQRCLILLGNNDNLSRLVSLLLTCIDMFCLPNPSPETPGSKWRRVFQCMPGAPGVLTVLSPRHERRADRWRVYRRQCRIRLQPVVAGLSWAKSCTN